MACMVIAALVHMVIGALMHMIIAAVMAGNEDHLYVVPATNLLQQSVEPSILLLIFNL